MVANHNILKNNSKNLENARSMRKILLDLWENVPEEQRGETIAILLDKTRGWHEMGVTPQSAITWLAVQFDKANVDMPPRLAKHIR